MTHPVCWVCKTPVDFSLTHCNSKHCPWCKACHKAKHQEAKP